MDATERLPAARRVHRQRLRQPGSARRRGAEAPGAGRPGGRSSPATLAKERAYQHVKALLVGARPVAGAFLTEAEVAADLGMSRTPVREAFLRLEAEGLLRLVPQKGAFVPPISEREMREVMEAREVIEAHSVRRAAADGGAVAADLERLLAQQRRHAQDVEAFIRADRQFHQRIVEAAGNDLLSRLYESLRDRQLRLGIRAVVSNPDRVRQVVAEHRAIAAAVARGDAEGAEQALRAHLRATLDILLKETRG